ncbi:lipoate synthase [Candidatus Sulfobium mesophilum]|uniref:Lipoyl synthase n=1 Tax=Candidatus Sulfobium mesophilum TaxID=2016548 RepID=A0A2U3QEE4_9BACT|nr:lipoate synthase [Candidatus Sulfobium mesophilum]
MRQAFDFLLPDLTKSCNLFIFISMRLPDWIRTQCRADRHETKLILRKHGITTVCEEARCPNSWECFSKPTATFLILGPKCTRNCGFCSVSSSVPGPPDENEPDNVAHAAEEIGLKYVVITSVTRDDLPDGGAGHFARTISAVRRRLPAVRIEVLTPDFQGDFGALRTVLDAGPDVFNHNVETVERLYPIVRPQAVFRRSLSVLKHAKTTAPDTITKSGFMLGLGESQTEVLELLRELRAAGCDVVTIGQYLRPTRNNLPVVEYIHPDFFEYLRLKALEMGFSYVASGPLVRSSMNAAEMFGPAPGL